MNDRNDKQLNFFVLQASDYFTFEQDFVMGSVGNITQNITLTKGKRQSVILPSNIAEEWQVVNN